MLYCVRKFCKAITLSVTYLFGSLTLQVITLYYQSYNNAYSVILQHSGSYINWHQIILEFVFVKSYIEKL